MKIRILSIILLCFLGDSVLADVITDFANALNKKDEKAFRATCSQTFWETDSYWDSAQRFFRKGQERFLIEEIERFGSGHRSAAAFSVKSRDPKRLGLETIYVLFSNDLAEGVTENENHALFFLGGKAPAFFELESLPTHPRLDQLGAKLELTPNFSKRANKHAKELERTCFWLEEARRGVVVWTGQFVTPTSSDKVKFGVYCRQVDAKWEPYFWSDEIREHPLFSLSLPDARMVPSVENLSKCKSNLRTLSMSLQIWQLDNDGKLPNQLSKLVPKYLEDLLYCPAARESGMNGFYAVDSLETVSPNFERFEVYCSGHYHSDENVPKNFPRLNPDLGDFVSW